MDHQAINSAIRLLSTALSLAINYMGTSALALGLGLIYFVGKAIGAYRRDGWAAVSAEWKGGAKWGSLLTLGAWLLLFFYCVVITIYSDHVRPQQMLAQLRSTIDNRDNSIKDRDSKIGALNNDLATKDGTIKVLQEQVRTQQVTINGALLQLGQALATIESNPISNRTNSGQRQSTSGEKSSKYPYSDEQDDNARPITSNLPWRD